MPLLFNCYPAARSLLFRMDAEDAHNTGLRWLKRIDNNSLLKLLFPATPLVPTKLMGLTLKNPIGLAAGLDKNANYVDALANFGFGFMEMGTVTPKAQSGNAKPRLFRLPEAQAIINRMGFNNDGLSIFLENINASHYRRRGGILGINIGKNATTPIEAASSDYLLGLVAAYPVADYITINISSPNTQNLRSLQSGDELSQLLSALKEQHTLLADEHQRYVPMVVKIAPDIDDEQIGFMVDKFLSYGIDGVIATNTTLSRDIVKDLPHGQETGGLSGAPVHQLSLRVIEKIRHLAGPDFPIIGVGGIMDGQNAKQTLNAGANALQLYSGLIYKGPQLVHDCISAYRDHQLSNV